MTSYSNSTWFTATKTWQLPSGLAVVVAVPVAGASTISNVAISIATAGTQTLHGWAALYSNVPTPALLAQSADIGGGHADFVYPYVVQDSSPQSALDGATGAFTIALSSSVTITAANAPGSIIYAAVMVASGGASGCCTPVLNVAPGPSVHTAACSVDWACLFGGSQLAGTAPSTVVPLSPKVALLSVIPILTLS